MDLSKLSDVFQYDIWITDLLGHLRIFTIKHIDETHLANGVGFDGSSIHGFGSINESDFVAMPDVNTLRIYPWTNNGVKSAFVIADVYEGYSLKRSPRDPRYLAQRLEKVLKTRGLMAFVSPEMEFFIYDTGNAPSKDTLPIERQNSLISPKDGYFRHTPVDQLYNFRIELVKYLDKIGLEPTKCHHEVGAGQIEVNIREQTPLKIGDNIQIFKYVARYVAHRMNLTATFMPKPVYDDNGSGMHIHISLWENGRNIFYDISDDYAELSQIARYFIGGILEHAEALSAIVAPTVNSYKRLIPGFEAPVYICWGRKNRSALIRVPLYNKKGSKGNERSARIEVRFPDPLANPYLAVSSLIFAGLYGIDKKVDPGDPVDFDVHHLSKDKLTELGIRQLPHNLNEALDYLESNSFLKDVFGSDLFDTYIELKREEWREFMSIITEWEYKKYFLL